MTAQNDAPSDDAADKEEAAREARRRRRVALGAPQSPPPDTGPLDDETPQGSRSGGALRARLKERAQTENRGRTHQRENGDNAQRTGTANAEPGAHMVSAVTLPFVDEKRAEIHTDREKVPPTPIQRDFGRDIEVLEVESPGFAIDLTQDRALLELQSLFVTIPPRSTHHCLSAALKRRVIPDPSEADQEGTERLLRLLKRGEDRTEEFRDMRFVYTSRHETEQVEEWAPILKWHDGLRGMAQWMIHHQRNEHGHIPVPAKGIKAAYGLPDSADGGRNYVSQRDLLWLYKCFVDRQLVWSKYSKGHCRHAIHHGIPDAVMEEAREFYYDRRGKEKVLFMKPDVSERTAKKYRKRTFERMAEKRRTPEEAEITPPEESQKIRAYMNELSREARTSRGTSMFTAWTKNTDDAVHTLLDVAEGNPEVFDKGIRQSVKMLRRFEELPYMLYQEGNYTPRPTPVGANNLVGVDSAALPALLEEGRHALLDLSKAQLAVAAKVLEERFDQEVRTINKALERHLDAASDYDLWGSLLRATELDRGEAGKNAVKRGTYSAVFGAKENTIKHNISKTYAGEGKDYPPRDHVEGFMEHPVIKNLLEARCHARQQILDHDCKRGKTEDAFGNRLNRTDFKQADEQDLDTEYRDFDGDDYQESRVNKGAKPLLAYMMQSYEVKLMWPIFESAIKERGRDGNDRWRVMQYRYDGIVLWSRRKRDRKRWIEHAQNLVEEQAKRLGIKTWLDVEDAP